MATITEVAPDLFRLSIHDSNANLQFNHFLVRDEEPLLFHAGYRGMFPELREALERLIRPSELRWIGFSHFESDECGALNEWLELAPRAQAVCSQVGAAVMVQDFAIRPPRGLTQGEVLNTGCHRFRFCSTPHLPHAWDNGILFEETARTLLCSDLFFHDGAVEPVTEADVVGRTRQTLTRDQSGPLANSVNFGGLGRAAPADAGADARVDVRRRRRAGAA